jgi:ribonuclease VapC
LTEVVTTALRERLVRERARRLSRDDLPARLRKMSERLRGEAGIELVPVDAARARAALRARIVHGRGMGPGGTLNFGDAFCYALAKSLDAPLLFVDDDFAATDIMPALAPDPG